MSNASKFKRIQKAIAVMREARTGNINPSKLDAAIVDLNALMAEVSTYDNELDSAEKAPDGDSYNELYAIVVN